MAGAGNNHRPLLELRQVSAGYSGTEDVVREIDLEMGRGEIAAVVSLDMSGGLSTLLKVSAGLLAPTSGQVLFDGQDIYELGYRDDQTFRSRCAVVLEGGALMVNRTIWENVSLPLRYHGTVRGRELKVTVERLLAQCGYNEDVHAFPWQVSTRGRRLAAFARALARDPELVLVDRFFEGLEMPDWRRLFELVMELNQSAGVSWLLVSELDPAIFQVAERVAVIEDGRLIGYDFRRKLYEDARIRAAFDAADVKHKQRRDSERILIVDSSEEFDVLGTGSELRGSSSLDLATPSSGMLDDLGETIDIDGIMPEPMSTPKMRKLKRTGESGPNAPLEAIAPPTLDEAPGAETTIDLDRAARADSGEDSDDTVAAAAASPEEVTDESGDEEEG